MTFLVTAARTILEASPTILGGVVVAAWLRTLATPERMKVIFRGEGYQGVLRTVLVAMTLPVCSIGVLPVLRELRRLGLPNSKLIIIALVAPLLNPISVLYGLAVLSAAQVVLIAVSSGILAITLGDVSSRFAISSRIAAADLPAGLTGATRLRNLLIAAGRIVTSWTALDLMIVIVVSGLVASLIPNGTFRDVCDPANRGGPFIASLLTLPQYVGPARGIIQFSAIDRINQSIPTGLVIYVFGVSVSAGMVLLLNRWYGLRRMMALAVAIFLVVYAAAYTSSVLIHTPNGSVDETDALDGLTRPTKLTFAQLGGAITESITFNDPLILLGTVSLLLLTPAGVFIRMAKVGYRDDDPEAVIRAGAGRMSKAVPASQLGAMAVCGMAVFFCFATYIFLPSPSECLKEMQAIEMDANLAIRGRKASLAIELINAWDSMAAKLPISSAVYLSFPTRSQRQATRDLRMALHNMGVFLRDGDMVSARKKFPDLSRLLTETEDSFKGTLP
ncbi:permease [Symmachiella macrocystis]|uniref:permease n=1 Tax=Symmachiella macrocystis TaxID=2527985 RepID=UPI0018D49FAC|nr:permease [Symmachiella macrocystis]